jgi:hypothetical protein
MAAVASLSEQGPDVSFKVFDSLFRRFTGENMSGFGTANRQCCKSGQENRNSAPCQQASANVGKRR